MKNPHNNVWCLCALVAAWTPCTFSDTVLQTNFAPTSDVDWNNIGMWGGNDYPTAAGATSTARSL